MKWEIPIGEIAEEGREEVLKAVDNNQFVFFKSLKGLAKLSHFVRAEICKQNNLNNRIYLAKASNVIPDSTYYFLIYLTPFGNGNVTRVVFSSNEEVLKYIVPAKTLVRGCIDFSETSLGGGRVKNLTCDYKNDLLLEEIGIKDADGVNAFVKRRLTDYIPARKGTVHLGTDQTHYEAERRAISSMER
jgi:hypothetical protein